MEARIAQMIEEEVERRVNDKLTKVLEYISQTYDVSIKQLMKDSATINPQSETCLGLTAKNKRCGNKACKKVNNGYCSRHQSQKPTVVRTISTTTLQNPHNHPPSQLFVKGCPGCDRRPKTNLLVDF